jgi:hypothetical protein
MSEPRVTDTALPLVAVYEAINDSLRETYVGTTSLPFDAVASHFRRNPPPAAAHWKTEQKVIVNIVEDSLRLNDALDFIQHYAASLEAVGWRALREDG